MTTESDLQAFNRCYAATILPEQRANKKDDAMTDKIMTADELWHYHRIRCRPMDSGCIVIEKMVKDSVWENASITPYYPNMPAARRAATEIVRRKQRPKVERIDLESVPTMGELAHLLHIANLYRITDPDGTVRAVQRAGDGLVSAGEARLESIIVGDYTCPPCVEDELKQARADQRLIREQEDDNG